VAKDLKTLPSDADFVIHLGNIQDTTTTLCPSSRYSDVASIWNKSPVPALVIPGAHDWALCPKPDGSLEFWKESFVDFENNFKYVLPVNRQREQLRIFGMVYNGVLFIGLHLVSGPVWNKRTNGLCCNKTVCDLCMV
jgi:hypothetical protein